MIMIPCDASVSTLESTEPRRRSKLVKNVEYNNNGQVQSSQSLKQTNIRFAEDLSTTHLIEPCSEFSNEEMENLWYSSRDFDKFKTLQRILAKNTRMRGIEVTGPVDQGYIKAKQLAFSLEENALPRFLERVDSHIDPLCIWARRKSTCRGLEYWISRIHNIARQETKADHSARVVELSQFNESPEVIAATSMEYSRGSRILARFMGEADAQFRISRSRYEQLKQEIMEDYFARITQERHAKYQASEEQSETVASYYDDSDTDVEESHEDVRSEANVNPTQQELAAALVGC